MHENRETSGTSWSNSGRDRSAKAESRTAGMHAPEESDGTIVPIKRLNKGEQSPAEVVEGRVQTQENIARSKTSPTQSGKRVSQGLSGVRQAAKERKQERFTNVSTTRLYDRRKSRPEDKPYLPRQVLASTVFERFIEALRSVNTWNAAA
jgi:hypothetical protein